MSQEIDLSQLSKISITPEAVEVLAKIYISCPITPSTLSDFEKVKTLADLQDITRLTMIDLLDIAEAEDSNQIDVDHIVYVFAGPKHLEKLEQRSTGQGVISTGQSYSQRLAELDMSLETPPNQAQFCLIDMLTDAQVTQVNGNLLTLKKKAGLRGLVTIKNCFTPDEVEVEKGDTVLTHYGMAIIKVGQLLSEEEINATLIHQAKHPYLKTMITSLAGDIVDWQQICASSDRDGFNSNQWVQDHLQ